MTDAKPPLGSPNPLFLREEELRQGIEWLFYAYRDFTAEADAILAKTGLGRAHHRALYFIGRHPDLTVADLLKILRITKQSLSRVLSVLMQRGLVAQRPGQRDRRQRQLRLTEAGAALEAELARLQQTRMAQAYRQAGAEAVAGFQKVLFGLMDERPHLSAKKTL